MLNILTTNQDYVIIELYGANIILLLFLIILIGCSSSECTETCRHSGFFDTCPSSKRECAEKFLDNYCDDFTWEEELMRCKVINCFVCFSPDEEEVETEEFIEGNKLTIIERNPVTGSERIIEWDLEVEGIKQ